MYNAEPIVGNWYHHPGTARKFTVVDVDDIKGDIELLYNDGSVDHIDFFIWGNLGARIADAPDTHESEQKRGQDDGSTRATVHDQQEESNSRRRLG